MDNLTPTEPAVPALVGEMTVAEIVEAYPVSMVAAGKTAIQDIGARLRQISGLKPGSKTIRTDEMIEAILQRLVDGETVTSIMTDPEMPSSSAFWNWCASDTDLDQRVRTAQAIGQRALADIRLNIAQGGEFSTGDARRDELLIKTISANIAQRNRQEFGERTQVDVRQAVAFVIPPEAMDY